jgi:hypothetical protein
MRNLLWNVWQQVMYIASFQLWRPSLTNSVTLTTTGSEKCKSEKKHNCIHLHLFWDFWRKKGEISTVNTTYFLQKMTDKNLCIMPWSKGSLQGPYSGAYKIFWSWLRTNWSNFTKFNFCVSLNIVWVFYITFNWHINKNAALIFIPFISDLEL